MDVQFLVKGFLIGFPIAAVVGPIGILCIQRTARRGFLYGLVTGLGAATADACYGAIAAFGLTVLANFLIRQQIWIHLIGGLFLLYLGVRVILSRPVASGEERVREQDLLRAYTSTLLLTLTNPLTILSFAAILAGVGVGLTGRDGITALLVVAGVFCGSSAWWLILSGVIGLFRAKMTPIWLLWINRLAGLALVVFGALSVISLIR